MSRSNPSIAALPSMIPTSQMTIFVSSSLTSSSTHHLRSTIPITWPTQETLTTLVTKSSGQFIYASTVVKFVESSCHRPSERLSIILGLSPPGKMNPFAELDALYNHLLSSVNDIQTTLRVLSFYVMTPGFSYQLRNVCNVSPELFLSLEPGDIQLALVNLSSIVTYDESSGKVKILHASLVDFLSDQRRSTTFYIDKASTCTDFIRRILQCVKGPDGIRAGDIRLFRRVHELWIPGGSTRQLQSDILNFDLDAFIDASIRGCYKEHRSSIPGSTFAAFDIWKKFLIDAGLEYREALDRFDKSLESRLQKYQSDWRLKLLLSLAVTRIWHPRFHTIPFCRCVDNLLETVGDHSFHLVDQHALDLLHTYSYYSIDIRSHVDGDAYASAALHCMRFLSNPPKYSKRTERLKTDLIYAEWKATCKMTLEMLSELLEQANALPELVQYISKHDIHPAVQKSFSASRIWMVNEMILKFLSRANVLCTAIQRSRTITDQLSGDGTSTEEWSSDGDKEWITTPRFMRRLDLCCSNIHRYPKVENDS